LPARGSYKKPICPVCGKKKPTDLRKQPKCGACLALVKKLRYERKLYRQKGAEKRRRNRAAHWANRDARVKAMRKRYPAIQAEERKRQKVYYKKNRARVLKRADARRRMLKKIAPHVLKEYRQRHNKRYPHKRTARSAAYRAKILRATPPWSDRAKIDEVYALAELMTRLLGVKYSVDHYYPLRGKKVCGLHVHENLRVIREDQNRAKANKMPMS
jgi:hypothetical protein